MNNKQRPRIRPVGALAAAAAKKQQSESTDPTSDEEKTEPVASTLAHTAAAARLLDPPALPAAAAAAAAAAESQRHRPPTASTVSGSHGIRRGAAPLIIRPGAASTIRPSSSAQHTDSFALAFHPSDGTSTANTNQTHISSDATQLSALPTTGIIVPYQHLGLLDPLWNIPPPNPQEKTLKDFCSKFKVPRQRKQGASDAPNNSRSRRNIHSTSTTSVVVNPPTEEPVHNATTEQDTIQRSGPLVEVINGEIVIQESSLIFGTRRPTTEEVDRELENVVVEEATGITATYSSFTKRQKTQHWSAMDTRRFFSALRQCGTDFSTMETLFNAANGEEDVQYRTRKQLKGKYLIECRKHPKLIDMAMNPSVQIPVGMSSVSFNYGFPIISFLYILVMYLDLSVFGELEIGTEVPPLLLLPPPIPTTTTAAITNNNILSADDTLPSIPQERNGNEQRALDTRIESTQDPEELDPFKDLNEPEPLEDEFTTTLNQPLLPLIQPTNKKRPIFRAALKGKKSSIAR